VFRFPTGPSTARVGFQIMSYYHIMYFSVNQNYIISHEYAWNSQCIWQKLWFILTLKQRSEQITNIKKNILCIFFFYIYTFDFKHLTYTLYNFISWVRTNFIWFQTHGHYFLKLKLYNSTSNTKVSFSLILSLWTKHHNLSRFNIPSLNTFFNNILYM